MREFRGRLSGSFDGSVRRIFDMRKDYVSIVRKNEVSDLAERLVL